jgi:hypothetical protein
VIECFAPLTNMSSRPRVFRRAAFAVLWLMASILASSTLAQQTEVITIKHRAASDIVTAVKPLVEPGGSVSAAQNQLIVRTTATNMAQVKKVVAALDHEPRRLLVTVRQDDGSGQGQVYSTRTAESKRTAQQVQVLDGTPAFVQAGLSLPVSSPAVAAGPGGVVVADNVRFRDLNNGFYVTPHLAGGTVTVDISARREKPAAAGTGPGGAETQAIVTTISGRLGEWIRIGGSGLPANGKNADGSQTWSTASGERQQLLLKVEELH